MMDVFYIEFRKNVDMKSKSDSESLSISQIVEATSGEPEVTMQPIKEANEVSETEDITATSNDPTDKLETEELMTKATESIAQVVLKEPDTTSEEDEVIPEVVVPDVSVPEVSPSVSVEEEDEVTPEVKPEVDVPEVSVPPTLSPTN